MVAKKSNKKTSKKGGTVNTDLASIAVPFGLLLAKQSLEKLSGKKMKAAPSKKKTLRVRRVAVGGANANASANVAKANANVSGVNTMAPKTGANVGGAAKKRGRKPKSKVGGANANKGSQTDRSVQAAQTEESGGLLRRFSKPTLPTNSQITDPGKAFASIQEQKRKLKEQKFSNPGGKIKLECEVNE